MKSRWIAAVAALTIGATAAVAAPHDGKGEGRAREGGRGFAAARAMRGELLAARLKLTDAQKSQLREINREFRESARTVRVRQRETLRELRLAREASDSAKLSALSATLEAQLAEAKKLRDARLARVNEVLNPEQQKELRALQTLRRARREAFPMHRGR